MTKTKPNTGRPDVELTKLIPLHLTIVGAPDRDDENLFAVEADHDYGPAPEHGWDNPVDMAEGKALCQGYSQFPLANAQGLGVIYDMALELRAMGVSVRAAVSLIHTHCQTPLSKADISQQVHKAYMDANGIPPGNMSQAGIPGANANAALVGPSPWPKPLRDDQEPTPWPSPNTYKTNDNDTKCAELFLGEREPAGKLISSDSVLYTLEPNNLWREVSEAEIAAEIYQTDFEATLSVSKRRQMVSSIHTARRNNARPFEYIDKPEDAPEPNDLILADNGIVSAKTGELTKHSGRYFATAAPAWNYDPEAQCPLWLEKVGQWLHPSYHATLQEMMGYCLTADTSIHAVFALIGVPRGGKSSVLRVLESLVGKGHHAAITLGDLGGDFGLESTVGRKLITIPDAHDTEKSKRGHALERIKSISGGDPLSVNRKNKPMITSLRILARIVLVANKFPKFLDESGALAHRVVLLAFTESFVGKEDTELGNKLKAELSGIANWAIEGLRRLRANGNRFTIGELGRTAHKDLAESQSVALRFANECLDVTGNKADAVPLSVVYAVYEHWALCVENLGNRERRNRTDFRTDFIAALAARGVRYDAKMAKRWRDPNDDHKHGNGEVKRRWLTGFRLKPDVIVPPDGG